MKKSITMICLFLIVSGTAIAQSLSDYAKDVAAGKGSVVHNHSSMKWPGKYYVENALKFKKVGILSIMVKANDPVYGFQWTAQGASIIANTIKDQVATSLKQSASEKGIEILTPEEYLTSEELKNEYWSLEFDSPRKAEDIGAADGYHVLPALGFEGATAGPGGIKYDSFYDMGKLAQKCGLDAFIVVLVNISYNGDGPVKYFGVYDVAINNYMVNQTPYKEGVKYAKMLGGYVANMYTGNSILYVGNRKLADLIIEKKQFKVVEDNTTGFRELIDAFATPYINATLEGLEKSNKKNKLK